MKTFSNKFTKLSYLLQFQLQKTAKFGEVLSDFDLNSQHKDKIIQQTHDLHSSMLQLLDEIE